MFAMQEKQGSNPDLVLKSIKRGEKFAVVVEGGGMRGVYSAGALLALAYLEMTSQISSIYTLSAGSVNAAFLLSGQGERGISVYFDHMNNSRFFNPLRLNKIVDVGYIYDHVVPNIIGLDEVRVRDSEIKLKVALTNCLTGKQELFEASKFQSSISSLLKASSALPVLYNKPEYFNSIPYLDGGITKSIVLTNAIEDDHKNIICIFTRRAGYRSSPPGIIDKVTFQALTARRFPSLRGGFLNSYILNNRERAISEGIHQMHVNTLLITPDGSSPVVSRLTMDRRVLIDASRFMLLKMARALGRKDEEVTTRFDEVFKRVWR